MSKALPTPRLNWALFLDVDGTVLEIAATPAAVSMPDGLRATLDALHRTLGGAVALISGRSIADLDALFAPLSLPAAGQHGAELRRAPGGNILRQPRPAHLAAVRDRLEAFAASRPGILIEDKGHSVTAHFRNAPHHRTALRRAVSHAVAGLNELEVLTARMAFEVRPGDTDKRRAVEWLMQAAPFRGRLPVYLGDDKTDEDGFVAAKSHGGHAIRVGTVGRKSEAQLRIATPGEARQWLGEIVAALSA